MLFESILNSLGISAPSIGFRNFSSTEASLWLISLIGISSMRERNIA